VNAQEEREEFPWLAVLLAAAIVTVVVWVTRG
jgi:hypothetical protein